MIRPLCLTCGTQYPDATSVPASCAVCSDERQYVGWGGQAWTTLEELAGTHRVRLADDDGVLGLDIAPAFAIGQRAAWIPTPDGNLLWETLSLVTDEAVQALRERGGVQAIAISHPHFYSAMLEWSEALGDVPILLHAADRQWVRRSARRIEFWSGERNVLSRSLTLLNCAGHFPGSTVLHWPAGANGKGVVLAGDTIQVVPDTRWVSFMRSYPNLIPLPESKVTHIVDVVKPLAFDRLYSAWWGRAVETDANAAVLRSAERYIKAITD